MIVIAGAGAAGLSIATRVNRQLDGARITVIDSHQVHLYQPGLTLVATGVWDSDHVEDRNARYMPDSAEWIQDATNVRVREVVLSWQFPEKAISKTPFSKIGLSLTGRNLLFFYRAMDHVDPESGYNSGNVGNGIEHSSIPSTSSYSLKLNLNF